MYTTCPTSALCDLPFARHTPPSNSRNPVVSAWARHPKSKSRSRGAELLRAVPCKGPHMPRLPRLRTANGLPDLLVRSSSARSKRTMGHTPMTRGQVGYLRSHRASRAGKYTLGYDTHLREQKSGRFRTRELSFHRSKREDN